MKNEEKKQYDYGKKILSKHSLLAGQNEKKSSTLAGREIARFYNFISYRFSRLEAVLPIAAWFQSIYQENLIGLTFL